MARILALDTATDACSVALNIDGEVTEDFIVAPQEHTRRLLPMVDGLLAARQLALRDLDAVAFTRGPGSFTGLRICVGVVQGLAFGADLPVIGISTLLTMTASAQRMLQLEPGSLVLPALDARMGELYWGLYQVEAEGERPQCLLDDCASSPADVAAQVQGRQSLHVVGNGAPLLTKEVLATEAPLQVHGDFHPHAADLARLAVSYLDEGSTVSALEAQPAYIRNEVTWAKRQRIRS